MFGISGSFKRECARSAPVGRGSFGAQRFGGGMGFVAPVERPPVGVEQCPHVGVVVLDPQRRYTAWL